MNNEKIIQKIKNLLDLANNNPNEHEAMAAALKAQELMAKHDIDIREVDGEEITDEIIESNVFVGSGDKWKIVLAGIVAKNFCCKAYFKGKEIVTFYGYKKHTDIASEVFEFIFKTGNKLADKVYYEYYKNNKPTKGVKNTFLMGFCDGISEALAKQCTALMIVTPKEVNESFEEFSKNFGTCNARFTIQANAAVRERGRREGKDVANARSIEAK